mgnify:CR=1 FL=1
MKTTEPWKINNVRRIGLAFNLKKSDTPEADTYEEYDEPETIAAIAEVIESLGFTVSLFEQNDGFLKEISQNRPDFVFNIAEGIGNGRARESQVPCLLESLDIPYTGSDPIAMGLTLDKYLANHWLRSHAVPVPGMHVIANESDMDTLRSYFSENNRFLLKPRWEGSSKGIYADSLISSFTQLEEKTTGLKHVYRQPLLMEEYLPGDEITVGICGNGREAEILGMMKISGSDENQTDFIYSLEIKRDWQNRVVYTGPESIEPDIRERISVIALLAFQVLELRDIARIDFRLDGKSIPKIIDINPLPGLSPTYSDLPILYRLSGGSYPQIIIKILTAAFKRNGMVPAQSPYFTSALKSHGAARTI